MAESIITLGIGATPDDLTAFITTGLLVGEEVEVDTSFSLRGVVRVLSRVNSLASGRGTYKAKERDNGNI